MLATVLRMLNWASNGAGAAATAVAVRRVLRLGVPPANNAATPAATLVTTGRLTMTLTALDLLGSTARVRRLSLPVTRLPQATVSGLLLVTVKPLRVALWVA